MPISETQAVAQSARIIFERIRSDLEREHMNPFVAIEPQSDEYFFGETISEAIELPVLNIPIE